MRDNPTVMLFSRNEPGASKRPSVLAARRGRVAVLLMSLLFACGTASAMSELGRWQPPVQSHHIAVNGNWVYMGSGRKLYVVDTSNPANIRTVAALELTPWASWVDVIHDLQYWNGHVFAFSDYGKLMAINVGNPRAPRIVSNVGYSTSPHWSGRTVSVHNGRAYICLWLPSTGNYKVTIIDVSNPANQRRLGGVSPQQTPNLAVPIGQRLYVGMLHGAGLQVYSLANPNWPRFLGASTFGLPNLSVNEIIAMGRYMLLATTSGLLSVDASDPLNMRLKGRIAGQNFPPASQYRGGVSSVVALSSRECAVAYGDGVAKVRVGDDGTLTLISHVSVEADEAAYAAGRLYTASGWASRPPLIVFSVNVPATPTGLSASQTLTQQVRLTWNVASRATSYEVWRRASNAARATRIATPATTSFSDVSATAGMTYYYWVRARNRAVLGRFSPRVTGQRIPITLLSNGQLRGMSGMAGAQRFYRIYVPAGRTRLVVHTWGGSGDADLYVRYAGLPSTTRYNGRSTNNGNTETVTINNPAAGYWYIMVRGWSAYSGAYIRATY